MKTKIRRILLLLLSTLLIFSNIISAKAASIEDQESIERINVSFTLDEYIASLESQGFDVEILEQTTSHRLFSSTRRATQIKITKNLPSDMVTPFGTRVPGRGYLIANYEEENLTGIAYPYFVSHIGHGIELDDSFYRYDSHWSDYEFTNGNYSVRWHGSGQFSYTSYQSFSCDFGWISVSTGNEYVARSPAYGWEFSYDFPQPV